MRAHGHPDAVAVAHHQRIQNARDEDVDQRERRAARVHEVSEREEHRRSDNGGGRAVRAVQALIEEAAADDFLGGCLNEDGEEEQHEANYIELHELELDTARQDRGDNAYGVHHEADEQAEQKHADAVTGRAGAVRLQVRAPRLNDEKEQQSAQGNAKERDILVQERNPARAEHGFEQQLVRNLEGDVDKRAKKHADDVEHHQGQYQRGGEAAQNVDLGILAAEFLLAAIRPAGRFRILRILLRISHGIPFCHRTMPDSIAKLSNYSLSRREPHERCERGPDKRTCHWSIQLAIKRVTRPAGAEQILCELAFAPTEIYL